MFGKLVRYQIDDGCFADTLVSEEKNSQLLFALVGDVALFEVVLDLGIGLEVFCFCVEFCILWLHFNFIIIIITIILS